MSNHNTVLICGWNDFSGLSTSKCVKLFNFASPHPTSKIYYSFIKISGNNAKFPKFSRYKICAFMNSFCSILLIFVHFSLFNDVVTKENVVKNTVTTLVVVLYTCILYRKLNARAFGTRVITV